MRADRVGKWALAAAAAALCAVAGGEGPATGAPKTPPVRGQLSSTSRVVERLRHTKGPGPEECTVVAQVTTTLEATIPLDGVDVSKFSKKTILRVEATSDGATHVTDVRLARSRAGQGGFVYGGRPGTKGARGSVRWDRRSLKLSDTRTDGVAPEGTSGHWNVRIFDEEAGPQSPARKVEFDLALKVRGRKTTLAPRCLGERLELEARTVSATGLPTEVDVPDGLLGVRLNGPVVLTFARDVDPASIGPETVQILGRNAEDTAFDVPAKGRYVVEDATVRFLPDPPSRADFADTGLAPGTEYEVTVLGAPNAASVRFANGLKLRTTSVARFTTVASGGPVADLFTTDAYRAPPPPGADPLDPMIPTPATQYASVVLQIRASPDVSAALSGVPLLPSSVEAPGNVTLVRLLPVPTPVAGSASVRQSGAFVVVAFLPDAPLVPGALYALRMTEDVKDLTGQHGLAPHAGRVRIKEIYDFLVARRGESPGTPPQQLDDPPAELIGDWPDSDVLRGVLKINVLAHGDLHPDELEPRNYLVFTAM